MKSAVELNGLLLKFSMLCHVNIQESSREDSAAFNFLGITRESKRSWRVHFSVGTMMLPPRYTGFVRNLSF